MLTWITIFTGLVSSSDVLTLIGQLALVIGGMIAVLLVLSPVFLAKSGFGFILKKVTSVFGGGR